MLSETQLTGLLDWYDAEIGRLESRLEDEVVTVREVHSGPYCGVYRESYGELTATGEDIERQIEKLKTERGEAMDLPTIAEEVDDLPAASPNRAAVNIAANAAGVIGMFLVGAIVAACWLFENSELGWR